jgi:hypothetical protein
MTRACLCRQEEASGQQIEPRSAIYVPFQHLQASDVPFDRALTPGQGDRCLNGGVVPRSPLAKRRNGWRPLAAARASHRSNDAG